MLATGHWRPSSNKLLLLAVEHNQNTQPTHPPPRVFDTAHALLNLPTGPHTSLGE